jgi:peptide/nickel transport system ATP-binding protein
VSFLSVQGLSARLKGTDTRLLRRVSLDGRLGEARGLVGESGAGKSMIGKAVLGILPRAVEVSGARSCSAEPTSSACPSPTAAALIGHYLRADPAGSAHRA